MKYYVVSDIHGYYTHTITALKKAGYFEDAQPHKLVVLGDLMDRGKEAVEVQEFIKSRRKTPCFSYGDIRRNSWLT